MIFCGNIIAWFIFKDRSSRVIVRRRAGFGEDVLWFSGILEIHVEGLEFLFLGGGEG